MISVNALVGTVIYLVIIGLVFWLLQWLIGYTAPPEPFRKIATVLVAIGAVLVVIVVLLGLVSGRPVFVP